MQYSNQQRARVINVEESDRLSFLPYMFGNDFMLAELQLYATAKNGCLNTTVVSGILSVCRKAADT